MNGFNRRKKIGVKRTKNAATTYTESSLVELIRRARELIRYLRHYGEIAWAQWLEDRLEALRTDVRAGIAALLEGFEGMCGLSDIYLCHEAGHRVQPPKESVVNEELLILVSRVYQMTRDLGDFFDVDAMPDMTGPQASHDYA